MSGSFGRAVVLTVIFGFVLGVLLGIAQEKAPTAFAFDAGAPVAGLQGWVRGLVRPVLQAINPSAAKAPQQVDKPQQEAKPGNRTPEPDRAKPAGR